MKASEITQAGFYWRKHGGEWDIVVFTDTRKARPFDTLGSDIPASADELPGDFIGPLQPPNDVPLSDVFRHLAAEAGYDVDEAAVRQLDEDQPGQM